MNEGASASLPSRPTPASAAARRGFRRTRYSPARLYSVLVQRVPLPSGKSRHFTLSLRRVYVAAISDVQVTQRSGGPLSVILGRLRLLMFSDSVLHNWPAKMSDYGDIDVGAERAGKTSGSHSLLAEHVILDQAATLMGVSVRHTRRILAAHRKEGAAALAHGNRGYGRPTQRRRR